MERIVLKAMRKDPANRYASALELAEDLARVQHGQAPRAGFSQPESDVYRPQSARAAQAAEMLGVAPLGASRSRSLTLQAGSFASKNERSLTKFRWSRVKLGAT